jgi:DNA-binding response OmpR family regulator
MKKNILIVEDELEIINFIKNRLDSSIYNIDIATDGKEAVLKILTNTYDLVTLDIMLPFLDGFEICKKIRQKSKQTLVIIVSALDTEEFKAKAYDLGADDYMAKPFSAKELAIKIKSSIHRRNEISSLNQTNILNYSLNKQAKQIYINHKKIPLTPSEYLILSHLIESSNRVFSHADLSQLIFDNDFGQIDDRGIDSHIYHIRKKIKHLNDIDKIKTIRGMGYQINEN